MTRPPTEELERLKSKIKFFWKIEFFQIRQNLIGFCIPRVLRNGLKFGLLMVLELLNQMGIFILNSEGFETSF